MFNINSVCFIFIVFILSTFILSLIMDLLFGELPGKIHPVVLIGKLIDFFKNNFISIKNRFSGLLLFVFTIVISSIILLILFYLIKLNFICLFVIYSLILSSTYSIKILLSSALDIRDDLTENIDKARKSVSYLVSRNTSQLDESFIVSATVESLTENITDSYIAPIFYFVIVALIGIFTVTVDNFYILLFVLLLIPFVYRIINTLDAMVGYTTDELIHIGFFPALMDDILNYIPARIAGILVVISSFLLKLDYRNSYKIMKRDARNCPSPNSGFTMASTAGALNIQLNKKGVYILGDKNKEIESNDINLAVKLSKVTISLFTLISLFILIIFYMVLI